MGTLNDGTQRTGRSKRRGLGKCALDSLIEHLLRDHRSWRAKDFPLIQELFDRLDFCGPHPIGVLVVGVLWFRSRQPLYAVVLTTAAVKNNLSMLVGLL